MQNYDIDTYNATFEWLATATEREPNMKGMIAHYIGPEKQYPMQDPWVRSLACWYGQMGGGSMKGSQLS